MTEKVEYQDLLGHLMEDHGQYFMSTGKDPENWDAAYQHLLEMHSGLHVVESGVTENLHFDVMSMRWRYNNGRLAETTETGPVRHRAPIIFEDESVASWNMDQGGEDDLITSLLGPTMRADLGVENNDLGVQVIGAEALSKFRRRLPLRRRSGRA
jgi:hypothetical protein